MADTKVPYEQRCILNDLESYLSGASWSNITYRDGFQSDKTIDNPQITVTYAPSRVTSLQLGKITNKDKLFLRRVQVDAYMENEKRAQAIVDDILDFFVENMCVDVITPAGSTVGYLTVPNDETVYGETPPPILSDPKLYRWRGIVRAEVEAFYPG